MRFGSNAGRLTRSRGPFTNAERPSTRIAFIRAATAAFGAGLALGRFVLENFKAVAWQVQIALALGFFGLLIALTTFASAGSAGAFALGAGGAYFMSMMPSRAGDEGKKAS